MLACLAEVVRPLFVVGALEGYTLLCWVQGNVLIRILLASICIPSLNAMFASATPTINAMNSLEFVQLQ